MHIIYEKYAEMLGTENGFGEDVIEDIILNITEQVTQYCHERIQYYKEKYDIDIKVNFDVLRATQAIIDTLEDLTRLKEFHPVTYPNRLKCAAYLSYWWLQRQPLTFSVEDDEICDMLDKLSKEDIAKMVNTNAYWLVAYIMGEIFTAEETVCAKSNPDFGKEWNVEFDYLFYYFCYRANSPKGIEALLSTARLHPLWEQK